MLPLQLFYKKFEHLRRRPGRAHSDRNDFALPPAQVADDQSGPAQLRRSRGSNGIRAIQRQGRQAVRRRTAGTLPFETFVPALEGFGMTGGVSYTKSKIRSDAGRADVRPAGLFEVGRQRTALLREAMASTSAAASVTGRASSARCPASPPTACAAMRKAETIVDGQVGYDFQPRAALAGLSIYLQGQNLTDEPFVDDEPRRADSDHRLSAVRPPVHAGGDLQVRRSRCSAGAAAAASCRRRLRLRRRRLARMDRWSWRPRLARSRRLRLRRLRRRRNAVDLKRLRRRLRAAGARTMKDRHE